MSNEFKVTGLQITNPISASTCGDLLLIDDNGIIRTIPTQNLVDCSTDTVITIEKVYNVPGETIYITQYIKTKYADPTSNCGTPSYPSTNHNVTFSAKTRTVVGPSKTVTTIFKDKEIYQRVCGSWHPVNSYYHECMECVDKYIETHPNPTKLEMTPSGCGCKNRKNERIDLKRRMR